MSSRADPRPLIAHVVYRFDIGGLENGVVNLINHMPANSYRHAVIALTDVTRFETRVRRADVEFIALNKRPGHAVRLYPRLYRIFRKLRPSIVHTRNLAALEVTLPAWAARVPARVHGEHGRDVDDLYGESVKHQRIRKLYRPFVSEYVAVSQDLKKYLTARVGVDPARVAQIYNGVDARRFAPSASGRMPIASCPFRDPSLWIVGTVGRMAAVKDQMTLARAFVIALKRAPELKESMRLVMIGDGPLRAEVRAFLSAAGIDNLAWLPGQRDDVPDILRGLDCFVLPSLAEGISNTILEAMASGLPVIATDSGGSAELVEVGTTGALVAPADADALAREIIQYAHDREAAIRAGRAGRERVERLFSLDTMIERYKSLYDSHIDVAFGRMQRMHAV